MSGPPARPRSDAKKNAVIALAILVLLLFLWKLMTRPEKWSAAGPWLKTNVFGSLGAGLGGARGPGTGTELSGDTTPGPSGNGSASTGSNSVTRTASDKPADSTVSNELVKVIADFSDEPTETNRSTPAVASADAAAM